MLSFALSLAVSRPAVAVTLSTVATITAATLIPEESQFLTDLMGEWSYWLQEMGRHVLTLALAIGLALLVGRSARDAVLDRRSGS